MACRLRHLVKKNGCDGKAKEQTHSVLPNRSWQDSAWSLTQRWAGDTAQAGTCAGNKHSETDFKLQMMIQDLGQKSLAAKSLFSLLPA